ncbi:MAG: dTMP kinase [Actinobacteria bacterium]|nr:dTMP kinase [Actinomycetota bacterium]
MTRGRYIAFEGLEGCGKSTHVTRLAEAIGGITTREPGGTAIGASLRAAMLDTKNTMLSPRAEALMMSADRAQHIDELVVPALTAGKHVVSDRSAFSSLAYQGYGRLLNIDELKRFNSWAIQDNWPELVIFIDVPIDQLLERLQKRELDRFEREDRSFFERIYTGFHTMAAADPIRWMIIDGTPAKDEVQSAILQGVQDRLGITAL